MCIRDSAKRIIDENFADPMMGLYLVSEQLNVSNSYLSTTCLLYTSAAVFAGQRHAAAQRGAGHGRRRPQKHAPLPARGAPHLSLIHI